MQRESRAELTLRGVVLGVVITLVFTAANVYFGLKAGLTFATSIPAAVISMALLRAVRGATIQDNNIVPTIAPRAPPGHLRAARPGHGRLVERLSVSRLVRRLRFRRHARRHVLDPAPPGAHLAAGSALPRRRGVRRQGSALAR